MKVKVQAGSNDVQEIEISEGFTVEDALRQAGAEIPRDDEWSLANIIKMVRGTKQASVRVDNTDAKLDQVLQDGQIVTVMPNIVGGAV